MEELKKYQLNIHVKKAEFDKLEKMLVEERESNRSWFMRRLINNEWARRHPETEKAEETCTR